MLRSYEMLYFSQIDLVFNQILGFLIFIHFNLMVWLHGDKKTFLINGFDKKKKIK